MANIETFTTTSTGTILNAIATMENNHSRTALIVEAGKLIGLITEGDVMRALLRGSTVNSPLREVMKVDFKFLRERDERAALMLFCQFGFGVAPVVDDCMRLVDVITLKELLPKMKLGEAID